MSFWERNRIKIIIVLLAAVALTGFIIYSRLTSEIKIEIIPPQEEIKAGDTFNLEVKVTNRSRNDLGNVRVRLELPPDLILADASDKQSIEQAISEIKKKDAGTRSFRIIAAPALDPDYHVKATVYYTPASVSSELKESEEQELRVKQPDFELNLDSPDNVFPGEEFNLAVTYKNHEPDATPEVFLKINKDRADIFNTAQHFFSIIERVIF